MTDEELRQIFWEIIRDILGRKPRIRWNQAIGRWQWADDEPNFTT